jgi:hypothetical protein
MKAYELLSTEDKWTKGFAARDKDGKPVWPFHESAVQWDVMGAIRLCHEGFDAFFEACNVLRMAISGCLATRLDHWNDDTNRTHAEVLEALKKAGV